MTMELTQYLAQFKLDEPDWIRELENQAKESQIPIMEEEGFRFLLHLLQIQMPHRILEIGTAIGYSAIRMANACPEAMVTTIEKDSGRHENAIDNINKLGFKNQIRTVYGDAREVLPTLSTEEKFDFIFIDAAKGQYQTYFEHASRLISEKGFIVTDNVLFRGFVYQDKEIPARFRSMVSKIRHYNAWLMDHPHFHTSIVPLGDGIALSSKKN